MRLRISFRNNPAPRSPVDHNAQAPARYVGALPAGLVCQSQKSPLCTSGRFVDMKTGKLIDCQSVLLIPWERHAAIFRDVLRHCTMRPRPAVPC